MQRRKRIVALVNMPFAPAERASIQIGILRALLDAEGIESVEVHANLLFYDWLRAEGIHEAYCATLPALIAEWFFSREPPFGRPDDDGHAALAAFARERLTTFGAQWGASLDDLLAVRDELVPAFLRELMDRLDGVDLAAAAFTMTFPQVNASLSLASLLKARDPSITTIFGGAMSQVHPTAACELVRLFPEVDAVVVGEAEPVFGPLCRAILDEPARRTWSFDGVHCRADDGAPHDPGSIAIATDMAGAPFPDYRGFLAARRELAPETQALIKADVLLEMSRGCAWAVKNVCTFCGFYPDGGFRPKPFARLLEEIRWQRATTGWSSFYVVDAYVTRAMINGLFKRLPREEPGIVFPFVELKSDITREQVTMLAKAGCFLVQPGIECLDDGLLEKIHKGVTLFDNVLLLKWCKEDSVFVSYNIILGVPDASVDELAHQLEVVKRITHLDPPSAISLSYVRASTYHQDPARYHLENMRADPFYALLYPKGLDVDRFAYEYAADLDRRAQVPLEEATGVAIHYWKHDWGSLFMKPHLTFEETEDGLVVIDGRRPVDGVTRHLLHGTEAAVLLAILDRPLDEAGLIDATGHARAAVAAALEALDDKRLTITSRGRVLGLPTRKTTSAPRRLIGELRRRRLATVA